MIEKVELNLISEDQMDLLDRTEYKNLSNGRRKEMIENSKNGSVNGGFFKFFVLSVNGRAVGVVNVFGHGKDKISVAPEIFKEFRNNGYAKEGLKRTYEQVKRLGFKTLIADIERQNQASVNLHLKLGFTIKRIYENKNGRQMLYLEKQI